MAGVEESDETNVFSFKDEKIVPDPFFDYPQNLREERVPLVIDNGTYQCRAGWATQESPSLVFKNIMAKQKGKKTQNEIETQIGNDITNVEVVKWILRSQFDRNIVTLFDIQEQVFDHIFSHMGINTEGCVDHPVVLTEAACNPTYTRQLMSELLFECYHIPQVAYGVDSLFSLYYNYPNAESANALVVDCGYQATHLLSVLDGRIQPEHCRRVNIGGGYVDWYLQRMLQLKYPCHVAAITMSRVEEMVREHCYFAKEFSSDLAAWEDYDFFEKNVRKMQLPLAQVLNKQLLSSEQQKERRRQQISRLQEVNARRRLDKLQADEATLQKLLEVQDLILTADDDAFVTALAEVGLRRVEDLQEHVDKLSANIQRAKAKILGQEPAPIESETKEPSFHLLDIPDEMVTPEQLAAKKRQRILKSAREGRQRALAIQREKRRLEWEEEKKLEERRKIDFSGWLAEVRTKRQKILDARSARRQRKSDMAKRRTFASQQRMRIISQLAAQPSKKGDNFGQNDADWDVYKEINKDGGTSDSEAEEEKLEELETLLKVHDPEFQKEMDVGGLSGELSLAESYRLQLGIERIRAPELLFQPSVLGLDQAGLAETMEFMLNRLEAEKQDRIVQNVFLTGGSANLKAFKDRIDWELLQMRPFQSSYNVFCAANPSLDAWNGARKFAMSPLLTAGSITRKDYEEMGEGYLREHVAANKYFPNPLPAAQKS
ncbi:actin-related protein 5 [Aplysia californica]|uniref:Actin-related protein 5 n=1 Tax=Aplysia californica TaxID=6500 RepID=A0ABM0JE38_APLCA|nr:actin-related protein 5 [Aplysia californica]